MSALRDQPVPKGPDTAQVPGAGASPDATPMGGHGDAFMLEPSSYAETTTVGSASASGNGSPHPFTAEGLQGGSWGEQSGEEGGKPSPCGTVTGKVTPSNAATSQAPAGLTRTPPFMARELEGWEAWQLAQPCRGHRKPRPSNTVRGNRLTQASW